MRLNVCASWMASSSWRQLSPALMITGLSDQPGTSPYGLEVLTRSTLSSHFSPRPPALRFHGDGTCAGGCCCAAPRGGVVAVPTPAEAGRRGEPGGNVRVGCAVTSRASAGVAQVWRLMVAAISVSPTSEGVRWWGGDLIPLIPARPFFAAGGFSTKSVTRTWLHLGLLSGLPPPSFSLSPPLAPDAPSPSLSTPLRPSLSPFPPALIPASPRPQTSPRPRLPLLPRPLVLPGGLVLSAITASDTRTMGSSPGPHTCANAKSTLRLMCSNDLVRWCDVTTVAAPPAIIKGPPPAAAAAAAAAVGDGAGDSEGDRGGRRRDGPSALFRRSVDGGCGGASLWVIPP
mmetsp:Transcript_21500/g.53187  ORF Transcript_21500/g.53187 Transcript_21500/m.53187 type:complete len:344 (-) Transcript_21500:74-1105(-)